MGLNLRRPRHHIWVQTAVHEISGFKVYIYDLSMQMNSGENIKLEVT